MSSTSTIEILAPRSGAPRPHKYSSPSPSVTAASSPSPATTTSTTTVTGKQALLSYFGTFPYRDAFIVGLCNSLTSVFAGVVVFAILGNLANGRPIGDIVSVSSNSSLPPSSLLPSSMCSNQLAWPLLLTQRPHSLWTFLPSGEIRFYPLFLTCLAVYR